MREYVKILKMLRIDQSEKKSYLAYLFLKSKIVKVNEEYS